jgi:hypothetical protein
MKITDTQKNIRAGTITGIICGLLLLMFFIISWTIPAPEIPPVEEGIEVNLGNSDQGLGTEAPMIPGPPAAANQEVNLPPKTQVTPPEESKEVATDDNDKEAPDAVVPKPVAPKKESLNIPKKENTTPVKTQSQPLKNRLRYIKVVMDQEQVAIMRIPGTIAGTRALPVVRVTRGNLVEILIPTVMMERAGQGNRAYPYPVVCKAGEYPNCLLLKMTSMIMPR